VKRSLIIVILICVLCAVSAWAQEEAPAPAETSPTPAPAEEATVTPEPAVEPVATPVVEPVAAEPPEAEHPAAVEHEGEAEHEAAEHGEGHGHHGVPGNILPLWTALPFVGILLSIALFPLLAPHFWHNHFGKVSAFWALVFIIPYLIKFGHNAVYDIMHIYLIDYIPFIILLWGLFTVAGGMIVRGTLRGSPAVNIVLLLIGTALASWIGTTGASMLLIRPVLRANAWRRNKTHVIVFFIFLVSNIGGSLTPLGDPPLFLGFIHGVDFFWTMHLLKPMVFVVAILLAMFYAIDTFYYRKESAPPEDGTKEPLKIEGLHNLLFFGGIMGGVLFSGFARMGAITLGGVHIDLQNLVRDGVIVGMGLLSLWTTKKQLRADNEFTWFPILEVAYLFAGIFATIIPALAILKAGTSGGAAPLIESVNKPWHFFWVTGSLSSFLDNAPTYLTFFTTAIGKLYPAGVSEKVAACYLMGQVSPAQAAQGVANGFDYLLAISAGAVFMGANTYIGNAPNFMVKSIAEEAGVKMPSFFGYMFKYSLPILVTTFILVTFVFFV